MFAGFYVDGVDVAEGGTQKYPVRVVGKMGEADLFFPEIVLVTMTTVHLFTMTLSQNMSP